MVLVVLVVGQALDPLHAQGHADSHPRALRLVRRQNGLTNPAYIRLSGRTGSHLACVHHVGRRSGKPHSTPVMAHRTHHHVIIPLPYGTDIDWLRNLTAKGRGVVDLDGAHLTVGQPEVVDIEDVLDQLPRSMVRITHTYRTEQALRAHVSKAATRVPA